MLNEFEEIELLKFDEELDYDDDDDNNININNNDDGDGLNPIISLEIPNFEEYDDADDVKGGGDKDGRTGGDDNDGKTGGDNNDGRTGGDNDDGGRLERDDGWKRGRNEVNTT